MNPKVPKMIRQVVVTEMPFLNKASERAASPRKTSKDKKARRGKTVRKVKMARMVSKASRARPAKVANVGKATVSPIWSSS